METFILWRKITELEFTLTNLGKNVKVTPNIDELVQAATHLEVAASLLAGNGIPDHLSEHAPPEYEVALVFEAEDATFY